MELDKIKNLPESYKSNLSRAVKILKQGGCKEIYVFGSIFRDKVKDDESDIDLAVKGCPKGKFFHLLGRLILELDYPVDLVNLDTNDPFANYLKKEKELIKIG